MKKALLILLFASCAFQVKNIEKHEKAPLLHTTQMPSKEEISKPLPSVVVVANAPENNEAKTVNAHQIIKTHLATTLQNEKFATIFERKKSKAIEEEITLASFEGKQGEELKSADYIIEIDVDDLSFSRKAKSAINPVTLGLVGAIAVIESKSDSGYQNTAQLLPHIQNTQYVYTSKITGSLKVYSMPKISLVKVIPLEATETSKELASIDSTVNSAFFSAKIADKIASKETDTTLLQDVVKKSIKQSLPEIKKFLQKKAYVLEKREFKKSTIFKINRGTNDGIKPLNEVEIKETIAELNPLTQEEELVKKIICKGKIPQNGVNEKDSWVVFEESCKNDVRLGHAVFIRY